MGKGLLKNILIVALSTIAIFCVFKYAWILKEKNDLLIVLNEANERIGAQEKEKQNLLQALEKEKELENKLSIENSSLQANLQASSRRLTKAIRLVKETQNALQDLSAKYSLLKAENTALKEQETKFSQENENLKAKLSSIAELKKAIRELKKQVRKIVSAASRQKAELPLRIVEGNRGYLIKDGKYTYPAKVKIEVIPLAVKTEEEARAVPAPEKE